MLSYNLTNSVIIIHKLIYISHLSSLKISSRNTSTIHTALKRLYINLNKPIKIRTKNTRKYHLSNQQEINHLS